MFVNFQQHGRCAETLCENQPSALSPFRFYLQAGVNAPTAESRFRSCVPSSGKYRPADISINSERATRRECTTDVNWGLLQLLLYPRLRFVAPRGHSAAGPGCIFRARASSDRDYIDFRNERRSDTLSRRRVQATAVFRDSPTRYF